MGDKVQEEMSRRARLIHKDDGAVEASASKFNGIPSWEFARVR